MLRILLTFTFLMLLCTSTSAKETQIVEFANAPYSTNKNTLLAIESFDPSRAGVMIMYFHGHDQALEDVNIDIVQQTALSDANAVLIAPRLFNGKSGRFKQSGFFTKYIREAAEKLAAMTPRTASPSVFEQMPIIVVFYSGGYKQTRKILKHGGAALERIRGIINFDGAYHTQKPFAKWIEKKKGDAFFVSIVAETNRRNEQLKHLLRHKKIDFAEKLPARICAGDVAFADMPSGVSHFTIMKRAWIINPLKELLDRVHRCTAQAQRPQAR